ncbi:MAG: class I SAM-dependent methyltransferase [Parachlamydiaceae bacterium]|nr:class I SAM-dependent methyltransferase [Parachlamydiaceae bacterium]
MEFNFEEAFNPEEYLYFYRDILTPERLKQELDFLVKYTELNEPLEILDLACGHGRHANALAQLGHKVTGIDITEGFLKYAREEASKLDEKVSYINQDMKELKYNNFFDRIFVLFTSLGYFEDDQNEKIFKNIFNALKPNGIFCFDSHNRDTYLTYFLPTSAVEREENFMIDQRSFDTLTGRCLTKRTVIFDKSIKSFQYSVRFYNPTEIIKLLKNIGFSSITFFENWEGKLLGQDSKRMIVVAKK